MIIIFNKMNYVIIHTTINGAGKAEKLADLIIRSRLAACVQIMPVRSIYRWKGKVEKAREYLLLLKTKASLKTRLITFIGNHHPYEVPEIVATRIIDGFNDYLTWIDRETKSK